MQRILFLTSGAISFLARSVKNFNCTCERFRPSKQSSDAERNLRKWQCVRHTVTKTHHETVIRPKRTETTKLSCWQLKNDLRHALSFSFGVRKGVRGQNGMFFKRNIRFERPRGYGCGLHGPNPKKKNAMLLLLVAIFFESVAKFNARRLVCCPAVIARAVQIVLWTALIFLGSFEFFHGCLRH